MECVSIILSRDSSLCFHQDQMSLHVMRKFIGRSLCKLFWTLVKKSLENVILWSSSFFFFFYPRYFIAQWAKNLPAMQETWVWSPSREDSLEKDMASTLAHSSILAWRIPWTEEPGRLYSPWGPKSWTRLSDQTTTATMLLRSSFYLSIYGFSCCRTWTLGCKGSVVAAWKLSSCGTWA